MIYILNCNRLSHIFRLDLLDLYPYNDCSKTVRFTILNDILKEIKIEFMEVRFSSLAALHHSIFCKENNSPYRYDCSAYDQ